MYIFQVHTKTDTLGNKTGGGSGYSGRIEWKNLVFIRHFFMPWIFFYHVHIMKVSFL